jgi:predicted nucleic acid-binding protein
MTRRFVLDAWAVLALLQAEDPAASRVTQLLKEADKGDVELFMSIINLGEVIYRVGKTVSEAAAWQTLDEIRRLPLTVVSAADEAVFAAAACKMRYPLSYADAFAAALTEHLKAILATGDPELAGLADRIQVEKLERGSRHG